MSPADAIADLVTRHEKIVLQFSAGKDSAACLKLCRPWLDKITVAWTNPGDPYPETVAYMNRIRGEVPRFVELLGQLPEWIAERGYPVEFITPRWIPLLSGQKSPYSSFIECCSRNLWAPAERYVKAIGATAVIRGQKLADRHRAPVASGAIIDGVEYCFPLEAWTDAEVFALLDPAEIPESYKRGLKSSLDCASCTAYLGTNPGRIMDMKVSNPAAFHRVLPVILDIQAELARETKSMEAFLG